VRTAIPVEWGVTGAYAHGGRVVSLSVRGCLVRTEHVEPLYGKTVHLRFPLPDDDLLALAGHVIYYLRDVGFAVEFDATPDREHYLLARLVQDYRKGDPYKTPGADALQLVARAGAPAVTFKDQRRHARAKVSINVDWGETPSCEYGGDRVTSISLGGCFIQTERHVKEGSVAYVRLWERPGGRGVFRGVVRYQLQLSPKHAPIGLGLEFPNLDDEETASLKEVLNFYGEALTT
jgi:hypothetical protein